MKFLGFEAYVTVDGVNLPEYDATTNEGSKTMSCWIPSEAGKPFAVNWRSEELRPFATCGWVHIDGISVGGRFGKEDGGLSSQNDMQTSSTTTRPLLFASIELTDDDEYLAPEKTKDLGDIILRIRHVELQQRKAATGRILPVIEKVHERSKKAMTHQVRFGEEVLHRKPYESIANKTISELATFIFRYRSIDVLRADGIAPSEPASQKGKRKVDETDNASDKDTEDGPEGDEEENQQAELKALLARIDTIQSNLAKKGSKSMGAKRVKTEARVRPLFIPGEVIDLT
ncbi:hypothetical protein FPV67DRAFT_925272 [Lyophyllum atratum]|nr:hypothetical protein FPV67DRAFT_925272 [Lyophyllum atratum]